MILKMKHFADEKTLKEIHDATSKFHLIHYSMVLTQIIYSI